MTSYVAVTGTGGTIMAARGTYWSVAVVEVVNSNINWMKIEGPHAGGSLPQHRRRIQPGGSQPPLDIRRLLFPG